MFVAQRHKDHAMVNQCRYGAKYRCLLSSAGSPGGDEYPHELAMEGVTPPELTSPVPEGFPLGREIAVSRRNTKKETIVVGKLVHLENRIVGLGRCLHLLKYVVCEGLADPSSM